MVLTKVIKRDGTVVAYERERIVNAIWKAAQEVGGRDKRRAERLAVEVENYLVKQGFGSENPPHVEQIQDAIEKILIERGHAKTAKAFIIYRKQREELRKLRAELQVRKLVDDYLSLSDWRVKENSNMGYSLSGLLFHIGTSVIARYTLEKVYPPEVAAAHVSGDFHIHDLGMGLCGYCFDEETRVLTEEGFKYFKDVTPSDRVATLNLKTGRLEFQHPIAKQVFDWDGPMYHWRNRSIDLLVTPEHRMLVRIPPNRTKIRRRMQKRGEMETRLQKYFQALKLHRERGWGSRRISKEIGIPEGTVSEWIYRGRKPRAPGDCDPEWKFVTASELSNRRVIEFRKDAVWEGEGELRLPEVHSDGQGGTFKNVDPPTETFVRFLGWYIAEGNCDVSKGGYRISISQVNKRNQRRIARIIRQLGFEPVITKSHVTFYSKQVFDYVKRLGRSREKFIPPEVKRLNPKLLSAFLGELFKGDGRVKGDRLIAYYTSSKRLAEDVVECLVKTGRCGTIRKRKTGYVVYVENHQLTPEFRGLPEVVSYRGKVYDLTVPNGTLLVERNGKLVWSGNCAGWSLQQLLLEGFNGVPGKVSSTPPRHLDTALLQMANFVGTLQNEWAGAQAFNAVDVLLAPFVKVDGLTYKEVKQKLQQFVYNLNISSRWGGQTPFTNISLSLTVPDDLARTPAIVGGKPLDRTYEEFEEEVELINRAFIEVMTEGDAEGRPFTFPIPTFGLTRDFKWDDGVSSLLFEMTAKYGLPYFQNFINSDLRPSDVRSMCCHLRLDLRELRRNITGGLFGAGDKTGSVGVVTINMPRIGYLSENEDEFFENLERLMNLAKISLEIKRKEVTRKMNSGLLPYTKRYLGTLDYHFSTIGLVGMNEACLNLLGCSIAEQEGRNFAIRTLRFMLKKLREFQAETGHLYNLEATPAEGTSYRLARIDKRMYPDIITAGKDVPYYTNSTLLPVDADLDLWEAIKHQEPLQSLYTGGTVFHIFLGESLEDGESCKNLVRKIAERSRLPYYTITPTYSICPNHGYLPGNYPLCPSCGHETEVYSRVVGYFRPVRNWNEGKQEEFRQRKSFTRG